MHSAALLFTLFASTISPNMHSIAFAHPLAVKPELNKRDQVLIGYRYVQPHVAAEYNKYGTLTSVIASQEQTGPGAYVSPGLGEWETNPQYWQCRILADSAKFNAAPKIFVPLETPLLSGTALTTWLSARRMNQANTLLFSRINGDPIHRQLLIPPYYLRRSYLADKAAPVWGNGDLGLVAQCIPRDTSLNANSEAADWGNQWMIPGWRP
ncbi:hypothetical protein B0H19DRAFT_1269250 [Mycena capillaripes]|nr:hypothetical protein B0H19DRAFT_1269250 [Mycena capillaripes]